MELIQKSSIPREQQSVEKKFVFVIPSEEAHFSQIANLSDAVAEP
jgi:hypothetical protein